MTIDARKNKKGYNIPLTKENATTTTKRAWKSRLAEPLGQIRALAIVMANKYGVISWAEVDHSLTQKFLFLKPWARKLRRPNFISNIFANVTTFLWGCFFILMCYNYCTLHYAPH